jgi:hypothetical protein
VDRLTSDVDHRAHAYERLGELYLARGGRARAAFYIEKFVSLWENADPALQPRV